MSITRGAEGAKTDLRLFDRRGLSTNDAALANPEAEQWVIASCLMQPDRIPEVLEVAPPEMFTNPVAQLAMTILSEAVGVEITDTIDPKLLMQEMRHRGDEAGQHAVQYLVAAADTCPTAVHAVHYAKLVRRAAEKRRIDSLGVQICHAAQNGQSPAEIHEWATADLSELGRSIRTEEPPWQKWFDSLNDTGRKTRFQVAGHNSEFNHFDIAPEQVLLAGAPPGRGKTLTFVQLATDALAFDESLQVVIANCEMSPAMLLDRQLARLARVPFSQILERSYEGERRQAVIEAGEELYSLRDRLHFLAPPFTMTRVASLAARVKAGVVVVDYLQRFRPGSLVSSTDTRQQVGEVMAGCRDIAMSGPAVIAISALSRAGEFRDSSECEFACDSAYLLEFDGEEQSGPTKQLVARCKKRRHGEPRDVHFQINGKYQEATAAPEVEPWQI